jgi:fructose 1,6-bisphosphatase
VKDDTGINRFELTDVEKKLVLAALERIIVRGRYKRVEGAKLVDYQRLVAKFSNKKLARVAGKYVLLDMDDEVKKRPAEEW